MCGRYAINTEEEIIEIREILNEISVRLSEDKSGKYDKFGSDAYPGISAPLITPDKKITYGNWGFEKWDGKGFIFNARSEGLITSKYFSKYIDSGRCVIPAKSYYEWQKVDKKSKVKYSIFNPDTKPLFMAGLMKKDVNENISYVIITREAAENISFIHDRMPLLLNEIQAASWISQEFIAGLLTSCHVGVDYKKI